MSNLESWNVTCNSNKKNYGSDEIIRVRPDCKLKVRLFGRPVKVVRAFTNDKKYILLDNEEIGTQLKQKHPNKIRNISVRYASWCFDRNSDDMRILDMPSSVARAFGNRVSLVGKKISTVKEGCDWAIMTNNKTGKEVRYDAVYLEETPLSEEEKEMVKNRMEDKDSYDLTKVFSSCGFEEAEERLLNI